MESLDRSPLLFHQNLTFTDEKLSALKLLTFQLFSVETMEHTQPQNKKTFPKKVTFLTFEWGICPGKCNCFKKKEKKKTPSTIKAATGLEFYVTKVALVLSAQYAQITAETNAITAEDPASKRKRTLLME